MRRYRTVILVLLFGILPMVLLLVLAVTVILPALTEPEEEVAVADVEVVEEVPPPEPIGKRVVLAAGRGLPKGALLTTGDLTLEEINDSDLPQAEDRYVYVGEVEELVQAEPRKDMLRGYAVRRELALGDPISWAAVVGPYDAQFLATVLEADRVAVSIPVSLATRQARLVSPGNRVDVLLAVNQDGEQVVQTIVENVRVLAVNSRVIAEADVRPVADQAVPPEDAPSREPPEVITVTLEVQPVQGEHLALGAYEGQLSLAIRPLGHALPPEPIRKRVVLAAVRPLPKGALLTTGDLTLDEINDTDLPQPEDRYVYVGEVEELVQAEPRKDMLRGYAVRRALALGDPISWAAVVGPYDAQFLATVLEADRVAVSIPVSPATRQAKLVSPGNRVDVLLAVEQDQELVVQTIVENVRVVAVNSRVIADEDVRPVAGQVVQAEGVLARERPEVITVTLEVQPIQGEHLALGAYEGQLSLAIRPPGNSPPRLDEPVQSMRSILRLPEKEPEPPALALPPPPQPVSIRVVRGSDEGTVTFVVEPPVSGFEEGIAPGEPDRPPADAGAPITTQPGGSQ